MLEEELCELWPADGEVLGGVCVCPVLVAEGDVLAVVVGDAGVGDGDAVDVSGQVPNDVAGSGQGPFHVDVPLLRGAPEQGQSLREIAANLSKAERTLDLGEEFSAKEPLQFLDG